MQLGTVVTGNSYPLKTVRGGKQDIYTEAANELLNILINSKLQIGAAFFDLNRSCLGPSYLENAQRWIEENVPPDESAKRTVLLDLANCFDKQNHTNSSSSTVINLFEDIELS